MNPKIFNFMEKQINSLKNLEKVVGKSNGESSSYKPFFNSLILKRDERGMVDIMQGKILAYNPVKDYSHYNGRLEIRMGDPEKGGNVEYGKFILPQDVDPVAWKSIVRKEASHSFWEAAKDYEQRYSETLGGKVNSKKDEEYLYFSKEKPEQYIQKDFHLDYNLERIAEQLETFSKKLRLPWVYDNGIEFSINKEEMYYMNSEGSKIFTTDYWVRLDVFASAPDENNYLVPVSKRFYSRELFDLGFLDNTTSEVTQVLKETIKAPVQKSGAFPTILDPINNGLHFHEVVGHSLEAHRMQDGEGEGESNVFKDLRGTKIAPSFIQLSDDPSIREFNGEFLNGHYLYDEDGVVGNKINLIQDGILRNYLHSRQSAGFFDVSSNGHCRSNSSQEPCSRMGNLIIQSSNPVSNKKLKKMLMDECVKQNKPYGLYLEDFERGWSESEEGVYATYPSNLFRIYANGKVERVRGANVVGTPHQTLKNIIAMDNEMKVCNGFCGAESGQILSSEIAPNCLVSSLDFNKTSKYESIKIYEDIFKD